MVQGAEQLSVNKALNKVTEHCDTMALLSMTLLTFVNMLQKKDSQNLLIPY